MDDTSTPSARPGLQGHRINSSMFEGNRYLRGAVAALQQRLDIEDQGDIAGQLALLRQANEQLVLATFWAADQQAAAELATERQTVFLSMLAHELRNPIASITFANSVMRTLDAGSPKLEKLIDIVGRQSSYLARLVDDLLDVSRMRTGKLTLQLHEGPLAEVLEGAIATAHPMLKQRGQTLLLHLPSDPVRLRADQIRLAQLFSNLIVNGSKFSPPNTTLHVGAQVQGAMVAVTIRDEGKGMAAQDMARMFELFEQGPDEAGHTLSGGLGIGLSLVRFIATMHGGSVSVVSAGVGKGCEFTVLLPMAHNDGGMATADELAPVK